MLSRKRKQANLRPRTSLERRTSQRTPSEVKAKISRILFACYRVGFTQPCKANFLKLGEPKGVAKTGEVKK